MDTKRQSEPDDALTPVIKEIRRIYARLGEPTLDMLTAYREGRLDEAQRADLELLLKLRPDLRAELEALGEGLHPWTPPPERPESLWERLMGWLTLPPAPLWVGAAAALLIGVGVWRLATYEGSGGPMGEAAVEVLPGGGQWFNVGVRSSTGRVEELREGEQIQITPAPPPGARQMLVLQVEGRSVQGVVSLAMDPPPDPLQFEAGSRQEVAVLLVVYLEKELELARVRDSLEQELATGPLLSDQPRTEQELRLKKKLAALGEGRSWLQVSDPYRTVTR